MLDTVLAPQKTLQQFPRLSTLQLSRILSNQICIDTDNSHPADPPLAVRHFSSPAAILFVFQEDRLSVAEAVRALEADLRGQVVGEVKDRWPNWGFDQSVALGMSKKLQPKMMYSTGSGMV